MLIAKSQRRSFYICLLVLLALFTVLSLSAGTEFIGPVDLLVMLKGDSPYHELVVLQLRMPRMLMAVAIGSLLACSGAVLQGLFRNPLADPSLIGVTAGASLGASLVIFFSLPLLALSSSSVSFQQSFTVFGTCIGATVGGAISVFLIYRLATKNGSTSVMTMLLSGMALAALAGSIGSLLEYFSDNETLRRLSLWRMGSVEASDYSGAAAMLCLAIIVFAILNSKAHVLNAFLLGESEARHLGIQVQRLKRLFILLAAVATGLSVVFAGTIAFVGIVIPHMMRMFIGADHVRLIPACAIAGAVLLLVADIIARTVIQPAELPVGLVTALIGAPFFIYMIAQSQAKI